MAFDNSGRQVFDVIYERNGVKIYKLTDKIYFRRADWGVKEQCNTGYVVYDNGVTVFDANTAAGAEEMIGEAAELFGKPITDVVLTHAHWDHADGLPILMRAGVKYLIAAEGAVALLREKGVELPEYTLEVGGAGLTFPVGDISFDAFTYPGRSHSAGDLFIATPDHKFIFTGDVVSEPPYLYFLDGDLQNWFNTLDKLESLHAQALCVGHGDLTGGAHFALQRGYMRALWDGLREWIGKTGGDAARMDNAVSLGSDAAHASAIDANRAPAGGAIDEEIAMKAAAEIIGDSDNGGVAAALKICGPDRVKAHLAEMYALYMKH